MVHAEARLAAQVLDIDEDARPRRERADLRAQPGSSPEREDGSWEEQK